MAPESAISLPDNLSSKQPPTRKSTDSKGKKRRRTKSGCLTCRRRRIKCDEGRPICTNCVKSKRTCEGYTPGIVLNVRDAGIGWTPLSNFTPPSSNYEVNPYPYYQLHGQLHGQHFDTATPFIAMNSNQLETSILSRSGLSMENTSQSAQFHRRQDVHAHASMIPFASQPTTPNSGHSSMPSGKASDIFVNQHWTDGFPKVISHLSSNHTHVHLDPLEQGASAQNALPPYLSSEEKSSMSVQQQSSWRQKSSVPERKSGELEYEELRAYTSSNHGLFHPNFPLPPPRLFDAPYSTSFDSDAHNVTQALEAAAIETQDDDYYDVFSDEETDNTLKDCIAHFNSNNKSSEQQRQKPHSTDRDSLPTSGVLATYRSAEAASPLRNASTARVFSHFIASTGHMLSIQDRILGVGQSQLYSGSAVVSHQTLWSYTIPMMALQNPSLLHAILAVSSLHIARLSGASETPSFKHYAYSLKRLHQAVSHEEKRYEMETLAATLLLGHYEVMQADHLKWSTHLHGAAQLLEEFDHLGTTLGPIHQHDSPEVTSHPSLNGLLEKLSGYSHVAQPESLSILQSHITGDTTATNRGLFRDLCWWYRRQDVYYAFISGNCLLQDFRYWNKCPPRARINDTTSVFGTVDYLFLILGRLAAFIVKDRPRKLRGMSISSNPAFRAKPNIANVSVPFFGMAPSPGVGRMPRAFESKRVHVPPETSTEDFDFDTATKEAEREWTNIQNAFMSFAKSLGPEFSPVAIEGDDSPFKHSITYRSLDIANMWMNYYMGLIIATRSHPSMPPAAQIAVGVAARQTARWAQCVGQIAAGIKKPCLQTYPSLEPAMVGCVVPLFFAAVQYQDTLQRSWTIRLLKEVETLSGWASVGLCAHGCEASWVAAAQHGRGPPYEKMCKDERSHDQRISGRYSHLNGLPPTDPVDRRLVPFSSGARLVWATGVLGTEEDLSRMSII